VNVTGVAGDAGGATDCVALNDCELGPEATTIVSPETMGPSRFVTVRLVTGPAGTAVLSVALTYEPKIEKLVASMLPVFAIVSAAVLAAIPGATLPKVTAAPHAELTLLFVEAAADRQAEEIVSLIVNVPDEMDVPLFDVSALNDAQVPPPPK
jgi:hypothetical protein